MPVQPFGQADPYYDALRVMSNQNLQGAALGDTGSGGGILENKIYLWPADGSTITTYDATQAGLIAALAAAVTGDTVWLPSILISLTVGVTMPEGVILRGISHGARLSFSGFTGTAITMAEDAICDHFDFDFTPSGDNSIGLDSRFSGAVVNHVRGMVLGTTTGSIALAGGSASAGGGATPFVFPTTSILDNFNRADEGPPPGPGWTTPGDFITASYYLLTSGSQCVPNPGVGNAGSGYWADEFTDDIEVYATITQSPFVDSIQLFARILDPGLPYDNIANGAYSLIATPTTLTLILYYSGTTLTFTNTYGITLTTGDRVGLACVDNMIMVFADTGSGWQNMFNGFDSTWATGHYIGLDLRSPIDDFGGGTSTASPGSLSLAPVLDDFNRSNAAPLSGNWISAPSFLGALQIVSNQAKFYSSSGSGGNELWNTDFAADQMVFVTVSAISSAVNNSRIDIYIRDTETISSTDTYHFSWKQSGSVTIGHGFCNFKKWVSGSSTNLFTSMLLDIAVGDSFGISAIGSNITVYYKPSGGSWVVFFTKTDASLSGSGKIGIGISSSIISADNFGGGEIVNGIAPLVIDSDFSADGTNTLGIEVSDTAIIYQSRAAGTGYDLQVDASSEAQVDDLTLVNALQNITGTLTPLRSDRAVYDTTTNPTRHASDIDAATFTYHNNPALIGTYTVTNPVTLRTIDLSSFTLNELAAVVGTLLTDLGLA